MGQQRTVPPLGVVLVHPMHTARAGLALLIENEADLQVLGQTDRCEEALTSLRRLRRRSRIVVLVALTGGGDHDPYRAIRLVRDEFPTIPVLGCGRAVDELLVSRALFCGAGGFVDYACAPGDFLDSIRRISAVGVRARRRRAGWGRRCCPRDRAAAGRGTGPHRARGGGVGGRLRGTHRPKRTPKECASSVSSRNLISGDNVGIAV